MIKAFRSFLSINPVSITIVLTLLMLIIFLVGIPILDLMELKTYDLRFLWRGEKQPSQKIVNVVIDEKSLDQEGMWPWPRSKMARLVDILSEDGAKVISFDVFFTEPDQKSHIAFITRLNEELKGLKIENSRLDAFIEDSKTQADNDLILAQSIAKAKARVVLPYFWHRSQAELGYPIEKEELERRISLISDSQYPLLRFEHQRMSVDPFNADLDPYAPETNIEILSRAAAASGYINMLQDNDGIVRWMIMAIRFGEAIFTPLSVLTVWHYLDKPELMVKIANYGVEGIKLGDIFIPTDESGKLLINYLGPPGIFPQYSITDILQGKFEKGTFENKIVVIGSVAVGAHDLRPTPFNPAQPGMDVHASIMENILNNDFISKPKWAAIYDLLAVILAGILTGLLLTRLSPVKGTLSVSLLFLLHIILCRWLFTRFGLWINLVYPLLTMALIYVCFILYHYLIEEKNKRFLYATFSSYLAPELIEEMVASETQPELGGEARMITAYFTDIQSFSTFSEILTAQQLVELLNEYLSAMTDILLAEKGTLDKYEGDAIVAFLGAPLDIPDHALRACRVGVAMQNRLNELRKKWCEEKQPPDVPSRNTKNLGPDKWNPADKWPKIVHEMRMRIGINTGEIVVGNMGSRMRMNYTMMGDAVNLAARLEAGAKQYGIYTCLSEYTLNYHYTTDNGEKKRVIDDVEVRLIDNIRVVGKTEPVKIYELLALKGDLTQQEKILQRTFGQGLRHYFKMDWDEAISYFEESMKVERVPEGKTTPSEVFLKRCSEFKQDPPVPPDQKWDGVYSLTEK